MIFNVQQHHQQRKKSSSTSTSTMMIVTHHQRRRPKNYYCCVYFYGYCLLLLLLLFLISSNNLIGNNNNNVVDAFSLQLHNHNNNKATSRSSSFSELSTTRLLAARNNKSKNNENKNNQDFVDVDFERVVPENERSNKNESTTTTTTKTKSSSSSSSSQDDDVVDDDDNDNGPAAKAWKQHQSTKKSKSKNLLELSLEVAKNDPKWDDETRIPFCRPTINSIDDDIDTAISGTSTGSDEYIDAKLAFTVDLDGTKYGIAVPYDDPVAIVIERSTTKSKTGNNKSKKNKKKSGGGAGGRGFQNNNQNQEEPQIEYIDPDLYFDGKYEGGGEEEEESTYQELMAIMASQVQEHLGEEYVLRKTPKVLTISGGLSNLTDQWESKLMPDPVGVQELLDAVTTTSNDKEEEEEKLLDEFYTFMRDQLGDEEFDKTMNGEDGPMSKEDEELMKLFDIPGLGTQKDDVEGIQELIDSISNDLVDDDNDDGSNNDKISSINNVQKEAKQFEMDTNGMSLKLISFNPDGKQSYSLVKLLEPYVLVGRYAPLIDDNDNDENIIMNETTNDDDDDDDDDENPSIDEVLRFELLSPEEERLVIPKLEELCRNDLKEKGLSFQTP